mmetsp:Transcript_11350/g.13170  ORF Transcript_11350/g.13170 Transcript_11350/m.13170 type:complete len:584 (+) Transcript_11350:135-1886(+)
MTAPRKKQMSFSVLYLIEETAMIISLLFSFSFTSLSAFNMMSMSRYASASFISVPSPKARSSIHMKKHYQKNLSSRSYSPPSSALFSTSSDIPNPSINNRQQKTKQLISSSKLSLAPMMEYTDRHFRHLISLMSEKTLCYTEMVAANALIHERRESMQNSADVVNSQTNDNPYSYPSVIMQQESAIDIQTYNYDMSYLRRFLQQAKPPSFVTHQQHRHPTVLQLGGSDPNMLQEATSVVMDLTNRGYCDYTALNLNCGCPSPKVAGKGCFGAALMNEPTLVKKIVEGMDKGCESSMPITVKCRIGTDDDFVFTKKNYESNISDEEEYSKLCHFIETVASSGVVTDFQIHARIAVLNKKFSPADNRQIPTLKYQYVRKLVEDYPTLTFSLNGGVDTLDQVKEQLDMCPGLNGVMVGRALASNPWSFAMADEILYRNVDSVDGDDYDRSKRPKNRLEILQEYGKHADLEEEVWDPVRIRRFIIKAITPLFAGEPNGKKYRIALDEIAGLPKKQAAAERNNREVSKVTTPVSELIMNAALHHISEEVLLRTPQESYERLLFQSNNQRISSSVRSTVVREWQEARRE